MNQIKGTIDGRKKSKTLVFRVPSTMMDEIKAASEKEGVRVSDWVREALDKELKAD